MSDILPETEAMSTELPRHENRPAPTFYSCANCGRTIGALEQPYQCGDYIVCPTCVPTLEPPAPPVSDPLAELARAAMPETSAGPLASRLSPRPARGRNPALVLAVIVAFAVGGVLLVFRWEQMHGSGALLVLPWKPTPGSVHGGAWVTRKNGTSDLCRGLKVALLKDKPVEPAEIREGYESEISFFNDEYKLDSDSFNRERTQSYGSPEVYRDRADNDLKEIARLKAGMAEVKTAQDIPAAYIHFANADSYFGGTNFVLYAAGHQLQTVNANSEGKFTFADVPPGRYCLYAKMDNSISFIEWLVPVEVVSGREVNCDLFNANASTIHNKHSPGD